MREHTFTANPGECPHCGNHHADHHACEHADEESDDE